MFTILLLCLEPPEVSDDAIDHVEVIVGEPATLPCPVAGTPRPIITWYTHGNKVSIKLYNFYKTFICILQLLFFFYIQIYDNKISLFKLLKLFWPMLKITSL